MKRLVPCLVLLAACAGGCSSQRTRTTVRDGWVRALPPEAANTGAFLTIEHDAAQGIALTGASSPAANAAELHTMAVADGRMEMRPIARIELPAHGRVVLEPGGMHLMLIGLRAPLKPGDEVPVTLEFSDHTTLELKLPVEDR